MNFNILSIFFLALTWSKKAVSGKLWRHSWTDGTDIEKHRYILPKVKTVLLKVLQLKCQQNGSKLVVTLNSPAVNYSFRLCIAKNFWWLIALLFTGIALEDHEKSKNISGHLKDYQPAFNTFKDVHKIYHTLFGPDHPRTKAALEDVRSEPYKTIFESSNYKYPP